MAGGRFVDDLGDNNVADTCDNETLLGSGSTGDTGTVSTGGTGSDIVSRSSIAFSPSPWTDSWTIATTLL